MPIKNVFYQYASLKWQIQNRTFLALLAVVFLLVGCTSKESEWKQAIGGALEETESALIQLERDLRTGSIRNALILEQYGSLLKKDKPEMASLVDVLTLDSDTDGPMFKGLQSRLDAVNEVAKQTPDKGEQAVADLLQELEDIANASSPVLFGLMLSDPINVIADMSDGKLPRVESMSKNAESVANKSQDYGSASKLVGNPQYGHWQQNSSGDSVWKWFAAYAIFNSMFNQPIYYSNWSYHRPYSYYHDYGRSYYTSPKSYRNQRQVQQAAESKFKSQGKSFQSPYAKKRSGSASAANVTSRATKSSKFASKYASSRSTSTANKSSSNKFASGYSKNKSSSTQKKSSSTFSSSQRSSSYKTSRSFRGGK